jgi:CDP-diacylglycerol--serine O-phosphatidyltransferase
MKIKQHLPSIFTLINLFLGFLAIINTMAGHYYIACYIILAAGAFDSVDGKIARLIGIPTNFGKEIDSLADMVSFCLAPSILVYSLYTQNMPGITGELIASAPLIMGAIRLARFNTEVYDEQPAYFTGLPTPMNALSIASLVLFIEHFKIDNPEYSQPRLLLPLILSLSYLMVSHVHYAKFPLLNFKSGRQNTLRLLAVVLFGISFSISIFIGYPYRVLAGFISFYLLSGIWNHIIKLGNVEPKNQEA